MKLDAHEALCHALDDDETGVDGADGQKQSKEQLAALLQGQKHNSILFSSTLLLSPARPLLNGLQKLPCVELRIAMPVKHSCVSIKLVTCATVNFYAIIFVMNAGSYAVAIRSL